MEATNATFATLAAGIAFCLGCSGSPQISPSATGGANQGTGGQFGGSSGAGGAGNPLPYQPKTLTLNGFSVSSAADGTLWIILGTDSGFEGITTLYYDRIAVTLQLGN